MSANDAAVTALIAALDHPLKKEIAAARLAILGAAPGISDGVKWNAPSFAAKGDYFATIHLRTQDTLQIVFHAGAKAKGKKLKGKVPHPDGLLRWLADDRAIATLGAGAVFRANRPALAALAKAWIAAV